MYPKACKTCQVSQNASLHTGHCSFWLTLAVDWISFVAAGSMKEEQFFIHISSSQTEYLSVHCSYSTSTG
jgi:hypothetical protein